MRSLLIVGAGGQGKVVCEIAQLSGKWEKIAFLDDNKDTCLGIKVVGKSQDIPSFNKEFDDVFIAIGDNYKRMGFLQIGYELYKEVPILIHPSAIISPYAKIEIGTVVMANAVVNPCAIIGRGCIVNTSSIVEHDCVLSDGVHISPGCHISGDVHIGRNSWIGTGTTVKNGISIAENVLCGCGSNVIYNISVNEIVVGNPAHVLRRK